MHILFFMIGVVTFRPLRQKISMSEFAVDDVYIYPQMQIIIFL